MLAMMALLCHIAAARPVIAASPASILMPSSSSPLVHAAAKQLRRYLHLVGPSAPLSLIITASAIKHVQHATAGGACLDGIACFLVAPRADADVLIPTLPAACLPPAASGGYAVCSDPASGLISVVGADDAGTLYGAMAFLELIGVVVGPLDGVMLPPPSRAAANRAAALTRLAAGPLTAGPVFSLRGLQPFHDFFSGPDWWSADEYKRVLESIALAKGNFIGLHVRAQARPIAASPSRAHLLPSQTYPIDIGAGPGATGTNEPAVWVGLTSSVTPEGRVTDAYPTSWASTLRPQWGMTVLNTSDYIAGADTIFEHDCFGHPLQSGNASLCPFPVDAASSVDLFNGVGDLWADVFAYARALGIKTALGTETPLSTPTPPADTLVPLNVYFSSSRDDHFATTTSCDECEDLYAFVGVTGYVYAGAVDGAVRLDTFFNGVTMDNMLVPAGTTPPAGYDFVRTEGYAPSTAVPGSSPLGQFVQSTPKVDHWAAADPSMVANATGAGYVNAGMIAFALTVGGGGSNVTAQDYYEGTFTRLNRLLGDSLSYVWAWTPESWEWDRVAINSSLVQDVVTDLQALTAAHVATGATFKLATCGWVLGPLGYRSYFDTILPSDWAMSAIDELTGHAPVDGNFTDITHHEKWDIPWAEDDPSLTAPELWLNRTLEHCLAAVSYNVTGLHIIHWRTRAVSPQVGAAFAFSWDVALTSETYWASWAATQFGPSAGPGCADILISIDSFALPTPVNWITGPGTMAADAGKCDWATLYAWVDSFAGLRPAVLADIAVGLATAANLEAFDYWASSFIYMRQIARMECDWATYEAVIKSITAMPDPTARQAAARSAGFEARISLASNVTQLVWDALVRVSSVGDLGTISNFLSQSLVHAVGPVPTAALEALAGEALPAAAQPAPTFDPSHAPMLRVLTQRSMLGVGEPFRVEAFVLCTPEEAPASVTLYTAPLGSTAWVASPMARVEGDGHARTLYKAVLPPQTGDFAWYIAAVLPARAGGPPTRGLGLPAGTAAGADGSTTLVFPPAAPATPATVTLLG